MEISGFYGDTAMGWDVLEQHAEQIRCHDLIAQEIIRCFPLIYESL